MIDNIKLIDQSGIRALLRERLEQPDLYVGKPLIIWCADFHDGIQERIVREVLTDYNEGKAPDDKRWFKEAVIKNYSRTKADIVYFMIGDFSFSDEKHMDVGLLVIDPANALSSFQPYGSKMYDVLKTLINNRTWLGVKAGQSLPMVCYMNTNDGERADSADFPEAEQYIFKK